MNTMAELTLPITSSACVEWLAVERCPSCGHASKRRARLPESGYVFGDERISFPEGGVWVAACASCGLNYKTVLPTPESLTRVFERQSGKKWMEPYDFHEEFVELQRLAGDGRADLLDIGAGNGSLLEAWAKRPGGGRRSALDVVRHPHCAERIDGEFIRGLIEDEPLQWSGDPYDLVTMFDVVEHLYSPRKAFRNLRELMRDNALLVIESGNTDSRWPQSYGVHNWWYVRLFEHHVFWSRRSLEDIARRFGFRLLIWTERRHKARASYGLLDTLNDTAQVALYRLTPRLYPALAPFLGKYWTQPWSPFTRDHFRAVLRKV